MKLLIVQVKFHGTLFLRQFLDFFFDAVSHVFGKDFVLLGLVGGLQGFQVGDLAPGVATEGKGVEIDVFHGLAPLLNSDSARIPGSRSG